MEEWELVESFKAELGVSTLIALPINPDLRLATHEKISTGEKKHKFGMSFSEALQIVRHHPIREKAIAENCQMLALDAYTDNFPAHKFFMNVGFVPRGFHFIQKLK